MYKSIVPKAIIWGLSAIVVVLGILIFISPPALFPDPANGFQVMRSMEMGGGFNRLISPDADDLRKNTSVFLSWWTPGQYLVPYGFKLVFGINTGRATALTIILFQLLGIWGFYLFFKKIGFTPLIAALSLLFIACQQFFVVPFIFYSGGELLLFGFLGWFLLGCTSFKKTSPGLAIFVLLAGLMGFFCKSSFLWIYAAGMIVIWIRLSSKKQLLQWLKNGLWIGVPAAIALAIIWLFYLSKGPNPGSDAAGLKFSLKALAFPLASPLLAGFSIDDLAHGLIFHTGNAIFSDATALGIIVVLAAFSFWLVLRFLKYIPDENYQLIIKVFYTGAFLFFTVAYLRQLTITYEARHFRILGLLIVPGMIFLLSKMRSFYRAIFLFISSAIALTSVLYVSTGYSYNKNHSARGNSGLAQPYIDQPALDQILAIDKQNTNAIFVFVDPGLSIEIKHNRVIVLDPIGDDLKIDYEDYEHSGHAGPLYIILPERYAGPREQMILRSFPQYRGWEGTTLSDGYVMYTAR